MKIQWGSDAVQAVKSSFGNDANVWKLMYDTEGCGCAVSGVPALWAIDQPSDQDIQAQSNDLEVWYEQRHEVFFDETMRITYNPLNRSFQLASDGQIYSNRLDLVDKRLVNH